MTILSQQSQNRFQGKGLDTVVRDTTFYSDHVVFQVEKRLFKVPRRRFEEESDIFRDMFALPASGNNIEGTSDECPLLLEGIAECDFRALLHAMFTPQYRLSGEESKNLTSDGWTSVLKLATMWNFTALRAIAIDNLTILLRTDPVQWISLARTYDVREWLMPALLALARRSQPLQLHEAEVLGIATVVKMAEVRENLNYYQRFTGVGLKPWRPCGP
ncbi:hypothetical protein L227DRAFT_656560 [Lentinus tigrinus ALCF2SS1-6]|uniref:BTB domain-containing protein n=1 Tax=Lentinus tigrinus ALCF2SS1-6 TaxID=1328759 RepID=A0A5C2RYB6_9APHY|nr:hypothetical protein L227DRAFT_656560 [Lentinus tigrinus ALCF2SS1-6]